MAVLMLVSYLAENLETGVEPCPTILSYLH